jgi:AraC-like DNA-binding protein
MQNLFSCAGKNPADTLASWAAMSSREFYDGELEADPADNPDFTFDKALGFPMSLTRITCRASVAYRRSWQHIRNNKVGVRVIWFVRHGSLKIVRSQGTCTIEAGEAGIIDSNAPFHAKIMCDADNFHESFQAIVPAHLFLTHLPEAEKFTEAFSLSTPEGHVVDSLLDLLAGEGDHLSRKTAQPLTESFLEAIGESIGCRNMDIPRRQRLVDKRLADIENYILMNLTDPDLCYDKVAASCGISPRYLCYVLKANNTSFSDLLWRNRLPKARDWLVSPATRDYPIHEIAFMSGFKSAAHFSRMFKATYGCPPREYRAANGITEHGSVAEELVHHEEYDLAA